MNGQYAYNYQFPSVIDDRGIQLATTDRFEEVEAQPRRVSADVTGPLLQGRLVHPRQTARMLNVLARVVRTHFYDARPPQMDPVVTASQNVLRFEGFSGCCGVYARLDLDAGAVETSKRRFGTTNVDFNAEMIGHLDRIGQSSNVELCISPESLSVAHGGQAVIEKKVTLPRRWLKGFSEVQVYQSRLESVARFSPARLSPLLQQLGTSQQNRRSGQDEYLDISGGIPRVTRRHSPGAVSVGGLGRLTPIRGLLPLLREVELFADRESGVFAWMGEAESARFWLVMSPALHRGFSGEGQLLESLATGDWEDRVLDLEDWLAGRSGGENYAQSGPVETIDPAEIAAQLGWSVADAQATLASLATSGLAGFDAATGFYFQRQLPMKKPRVEQDQPRLKGAKKLAETGAVRLAPGSESARKDDRPITAEVTSGETVYLVRLGSEGDSCTCPWFSRHQGDRGPCKHVLAARIRLNNEK